MPQLDTTVFQEFTEPVADDLARFDEQLNGYLRGDSPLITSVARHLLTARGKRIRPVFVFLAARATGNESEHLVDAALAIELIHTATLLHDDVVDESDIRRGVETVNARWNNLVSVLMGDYLFAKAFRIMVDTRTMELVAAICRATERVSVGELRQIEEISNYQLTEENYLDVIADKTASLFAVSCESGAILNGGNTRSRERLAVFGESIGTAFQITDDLLDLIGDRTVTGKDPGNDLLNGKVTLPLIHALRTARPEAGMKIVTAIKEKPGEATFQTVRRFIEEHGGIDYAYERAEALCREGLAELGELPDSVYLQSLMEMVRFTTQRNG